MGGGPALLNFVPGVDAVGAEGAHLFPQVAVGLEVGVAVPAAESANRFDDADRMLPAAVCIRYFNRSLGMC
ncbi:hypothetical protein ES703_13634 [subsurface metagenome]